MTLEEIDAATEAVLDRLNLPEDIDPAELAVIKQSVRGHVSAALEAAENVRKGTQ